MNSRAGSSAYARQSRSTTRGCRDRSPTRSHSCTSGRGCSNCSDLPCSWRSPAAACLGVEKMRRFDRAIDAQVILLPPRALGAQALWQREFGRTLPLAASLVRPLPQRPLRRAMVWAADVAGAADEGEVVAAALR